MLRRELARGVFAGERISIGTATDPYQPVEGQYRLTRRSLEALLDYCHPTSIVTKSTLVLRDLDVLAELSRLTTVHVYFTVTTVDPEIWRVVEPGTPPPAKRLQVLRNLREAGVHAAVFMAPVLPGITDSPESIEAVARAAKEHGASSFGALPLRLAPLVKEHYFGFVAEHYPHLHRKYELSYPGQNAPDSWIQTVNDRVERALTVTGFKRNSMSSKVEDRYGQATESLAPVTPLVQQLVLMA